jgi:hypothetical protein
MTVHDDSRENAVLALIRLQDQTFPLLPIRPLNSVRYTGLLLGDLGPTKIYALVKCGQLKARKLGNQTRITGDSIKAFIESLPKGAARGPNPEGRRRREGSAKPATGDASESA